MDTETRRQIAHRIHLLLRRELGQGIDTIRLLTDPLYARDVLLVCEAMPGSELAALAQQFRSSQPPAGKAPAVDSGTPSGPPSHWPQDASGFDASLPAGQDAGPPMQPVDNPAAPRRWLSPSRWLGRV